ncbi:MAG: hypothetical protein ACM3Q2_02295, partial [Syntrophothermus sp.]
MRKIRIACLAACMLIACSSISFAQKLLINEFMASNVSAYQDPEYKNYSDWIEIYNAESYQVNLRNYFISDDLNDSKKYKFTSDLII